MKRLSLLFLLLAVLPAGSQDFRNAIWGMSVEEVLEIESAGATVSPSPAPGIKLIVCEEGPAKIVYTFGSERLIGGRIRIPIDAREAFVKKINQMHGRGSYFQESDRWLWVGERTVIWIDYSEGSTLVTYSPRWLFDLANMSPD